MFESSPDLRRQLLSQDRLTKSELLEGDAALKAELSTTTWDLQAASVEREQTELSHLQWSLVREQISVFSSEVVINRGEVQSLLLAEAQLSQALRSEATERSELATRLEASMKAVAEGLDMVAAEVRSEAAARCTAGERFTNSFCAVDARLKEMAQRLRQQDTAWSRALEAEVAERADSDARARADAAEFRRALGIEMGRREADREALEEELRELRMMVIQSGNISTEGSDVAIKIQEVGVHKFIEEIKHEIQQVVTLRLAGCHEKNEHALDSALASLRADVANETTSRRRELDALNKFIEVVQADLMSSIQEEVQNRIVSNESLVNSNNNMLQAIEMEQQERVRGSKNTLLAVEMGSRAAEAIKRTCNQEAMHHNTSISELRADLGAVRQQVSDQSTALYAGIAAVSAYVQKSEEKTKQTLTEIRTELDIAKCFPHKADSHMQHDVIGDISEKLHTLSADAKTRALSFEGTARALERAERVAEEHSSAIRELRASLMELKSKGSLQKEVVKDVEQLSNAFVIEGMQHLLHSCRQEVAAERKHRKDDYTALRGGLECLDQQTESEFARLRERLDKETQERVVAIQWFERRNQMGELYSSLNPSRDRVEAGNCKTNSQIRTPPMTPSPTLKRN